MKDDDRNMTIFVTLFCTIVVTLLFMMTYNSGVSAGKKEISVEQGFKVEEYLKYNCHCSLGRERG